MLSCIKTFQQQPLEHIIENVSIISTSYTHGLKKLLDLQDYENSHIFGYSSNRLLSL